MELQGSALASLIQYLCMFIFAVIYILKDPNNRKLGNKIAFKRAVEKIGDKTLRTELWTEYKNKSKYIIK